MKRRIIGFILIVVVFVMLVPMTLYAQNIVGRWSGRDQTNWSVTIIFRADNTLRVMLREFTWDSPYKIDYTKKPMTIDIDDFEAEPVTGVNQRDYRKKVTPFLGIVRFVDNDTIMLEGYNGRSRPTAFSDNAITLTRQKTGGGR